jgi:putative NIF3 family GTP cyclohydrolase 1 type 2
MPSLTELASYLESIAPAQIAESWDNVGVLVRCAQEVTGVLCALDITPPRCGKRVLWGAMQLFRTTRSYFAL